MTQWVILIGKRQKSPLAWYSAFCIPDIIGLGEKEPFQSIMSALLLLTCPLWDFLLHLFPRRCWAGWKTGCCKTNSSWDFLRRPFRCWAGFETDRAGRQLTAAGEGWKGASRLRRGWQETDKDKMQGKRVTRRFSGCQYPFQRDTWQSVSYTQVFSPPLDWDESAGCEMSCDFDEK